MCTDTQGLGIGRIILYYTKVMQDLSINSRGVGLHITDFLGGF